MSGDGEPDCLPVHAGYVPEAAALNIFFSSLWLANVDGPLGTNQRYLPLKRRSTLQPSALSYDKYGIAWCGFGLAKHPMMTDLARIA